MTKVDSKMSVCATVGLVLLLTAGIAPGQVVTGAILGRVTDATGAVIANAMVQVQNVGTGYSQSAQTDSGGFYATRNLPLGSYSVTVQESGFQTQVREGITLSVASEVTVNVELSVGNVQEKVEVTAEASTIETTNATVSSLVDPEQMRDLPLNGRSIDSLALLSPGTMANRNFVLSPSLGMGLRLSVDGGRMDANTFLIDGTVVTDHDGNGPNSSGGQALGVEGILEFRLLTHDFSAEYGRNSGSIVSEVTRSGTNQFHGSVYEFVRNNFFDARNFFNTGGLPPFRRNQYGGAVGGPIKKDRLFFFANYEGLQQNKGVPLVASVPDNNARQGSLPCSVAPTSPCNPTTNLAVAPNLSQAALPYLNLWPVPNGRLFGDGTAQSILVFNQINKDNYGMARVDYRVSDKDSFYLRYIVDLSSLINAKTLVNFPDLIQGGSDFVVLDETHIFSGASVNDLRVAYNRTNPQLFNLPQTTAAGQPITPSLFFVPPQQQLGIPELGAIQFSSAGGTAGGVVQLTTLGPTESQGQHYSQNLFEETDTFSTVRGSHSLKFGGDFERIDLNIAGYSFRGTYQFGGLNALMAGTPTKFSTALPGNNFGDTNLGWRRDFVAWFVQDDYRVRPNLTLNLGVRQEFFTSPSEVHGNNANLNPVTAAQATIGPPFISQKANFSPRIGVAWDPTGKGKTSVRAGTGIFYNQVDGRNWYMDATSTPFVTSVNITSNVPFPYGLANGFSLASLAAKTMPLHMDTPTVVHYNFDVQQKLTSTLNLHVGYAGSYGYHMAVLAEQDYRIPQVLPNGVLQYASSDPVVNPHFTDLQGPLMKGVYNYNGLQMMLQKTLSAGLTFQASYTYSKALSDGDQVGPGQINNTAAAIMDIFDWMRDYGPSAFSQTQTFVVNGHYQMPWDKSLSGKLAKALLGGWAIDSIYTYGSGMPMNVNLGFQNVANGDANITDRPNLLPGFNGSLTNGTTGAGCQGIPAGEKLGTPTVWFNPCAFGLAPAGQYGNLGRDTLTQPGISDVDAGLVKLTSLTERMKLEFRAEFFNLFNHPVFALPAHSVFNSSGNHSGNEGVITATVVDNRDIQLGLKLIF